MSDPITTTEQERAAVLAELRQAAEQAAAWEAERNRLALKAKALGASNVTIAEHMGYSDVGVGKLITRERASASVDTGGSET
jgi:hypothetical protein